ncbi:MAG: hypothetical protein ACI4JQ_06405 [Ruminococcus sp.]
MTKEEWESVERKLCYPGAYVHLKVDGYSITLMVLRYKMKMVIAVYTDGYIKGEWLMEDCDIRRRFYQRSKHSMLTAAEKKKLARRSKSYQKEILERATYYSFSPHWTSFRSLKRHFIKNNESIELCEEVSE